MANRVGGYSIQGAICDEIGLPRTSRADVAICKTKNKIQSAQDILMIIEVKMSVVWNWEYVVKPEGEITINCIGDYTSHRGNPGLLRSDTMLKAIGKSINIRVYSRESVRIPIIIIGNTPITEHYYKKVDQLLRNGIIQGFWSINPSPLEENQDTITKTVYEGFRRFDSYDMLSERTERLLIEDREFFSSMLSRRRLGEIIEVANKELSYDKKAKRFLQLLQES